jgi:hypothetical protein
MFIIISAAILYTLLMCIYYIFYYKIEKYTDYTPKEQCKNLTVYAGQDTDCGQGYYMQASSLQGTNQIIRCCNVPKPVFPITNNNNIHK